MKWILDIVSYRDIDMRVIIKHLQSFGREALRRKLRGYVMFQRYCNSKNISAQIILEQDPISLLTQFILFLRQKGVSDYIISDSRNAISTFLEDMLGKPGVSKNKLISTLMIPEQLHVPHKPRYSEAWDISLLFKYFRTQPPNSSLSDYDIMIKASVLILTFTACRPKEVVNIIADKIQYIVASKSLLIPTVVKSHRNVITNLQLQSLPDAQICPVSAVLEWLDRKKKFLNPQVFLFSQSGTPLHYTQPLSSSIKMVLTAAGVPSFYKPYSIKHAVISALFHLGYSRTEVNLFTGHSELADTAPAFYLKSIRK
jgi:site-specific recombinase XerD